MVKKIGWLVLALIVIGGGIIIFNHNEANAPSSSNESTQAPSATITYASNGFTPSETIVKAGQTVKFVNASDVTVQVDSDPHPIHTDDGDLNVGTIAPGQSKTVTLTKTGSFGIHNHLDSSKTAKVTIQ